MCKLSFLKNIKREDFIGWREWLAVIPVNEIYEHRTCTKHRICTVQHTDQVIFVTLTTSCHVLGYLNENAVIGVTNSEIWMV